LDIFLLPEPKIQALFKNHQFQFLTFSLSRFRYCKNEKPRPVNPPFFDSVKDALNDRILMLVAIMAVVSIIPGMVVSPKNGWVEGVFILVALFVQVLITAWTDSNKDNKFVQLQNLNREESLPVLRGKRG
jgi:hypothetical protein